jgi:hypothetical protein
MATGYLALIVGAVLAAIVIKPQSIPEEAPVESLSCLCSPCIDQNIAAFPQRIDQH